MRRSERRRSSVLGRGIMQGTAETAPIEPAWARKRKPSFQNRAHATRSGCGWEQRTEPAICVSDVTRSADRERGSGGAKRH